MPVVRTQTVLGARNIRAFVDVTAGVVRGDIPDPDAAGAALAAAQRRTTELQAGIVDRDRRIGQLEAAVAELQATTRQNDPAPPSAAGPETDQAGENAPDSSASISGDPRDHFIARVAEGRTFADVGGLYGTVSEKVSVARTHGASELAMVDIAPEGDELWRAFTERLTGLGIENCATVSADIIELGERVDHPVYDVVHCTGVLYHVPDPLRLLAALRAITGEYLILGSAITATRIVTPVGTLRLPATAALFVPGLSGEEQAILDSYWRPFVGDNALGLTRDVPAWDVADFAPWWWLPTISCFIAMCEAAGFRFVDGASYWNKNAYVALLERR